MIALVVALFSVPFSLIMCIIIHVCMIFFLSFFCVCRIMKDVHALVSKTRKKVASKNRCKNVQSVSNLIADFGSSSTSSLVVDLGGDDRS